MPQRDKAPPGEWTERRDDATRRAFERFEDKLRDEFKAVLTQLQVDSNQRFAALEREYMTWKGFALFIVPIVMALLGLVTVFVAPVKENIAGVGQRVDKVEATVSKRLDDQDGKLERQAADTEALMGVNVDKQDRETVRRRWEARTGSKRINAKP